jgi:hypothetical protein
MSRQASAVPREGICYRSGSMLQDGALPPPTTCRSGDVQVIAFYLPQYHPIPENDSWWGAGFTDWTNVAKARPLFPAHHQPHIPADLGFYDLRLPDTREAQARLAAAYGISAFCYYHYWFNDRLLLQRPFDEVLESGTPDFPFCLCWANENWTRRWDGREHEVLIAQDYRLYDPAAHVRWLAQAFGDARYVRVDGRPLFLIYRASDIPDLKRVIDAWSEAATRLGIPAPFVCASSNSWTRLSHDELLAGGCDAIYEFEPNLIGIAPQRVITDWPRLRVYRYRDVMDAAIARQGGNATVFPCVFPSFDNAARCGPAATIIQNEDVDLYEQWLRHSIGRVSGQPQDRRIVFVNAWNEWAEGCHLEPDRRFGRAWLEATLSAVGRAPTPAYHHGSPANVDEQVAPSRAIDVIVGADRPLHIWGTGVLGHRMFDVLVGADVRAAGFIDNNPARWDTTLLGLPVAGPEILRRNDPNGAAAPFVLVASMFAEDISKQLEQQGLRPLHDFMTGVDEMQVSRNAAFGSIRFDSRRGVTCNLCGAVAFRSDPAGDDAVCARCGASTADRLFVYLLAEEVMLNGQPLLDWPSRRTSVLSLNAHSGPLTALRRTMTYDSVDSLDSEAPSAGKWDVAFGVLWDGAMTRPEYWVRVYGLLTRRGVVFLASELPGGPNHAAAAEAACNMASAHGMEIQFISRSYPVHSIGRSSALILRNGRRQRAAGD